MKERGHQTKKESFMFPDLNHLVPELKDANPRFRALFTRHQNLDREITQMEFIDGRGPCDKDKVAALKKEKLKIKDELYQLLRGAAREPLN